MEVEWPNQNPFRSGCYYSEVISTVRRANGLRQEASARREPRHTSQILKGGIASLIQHGGGWLSGCGVFGMFVGPPAAAFIE